MTDHLSILRADIREGFDHDKRIRAVETGLAGVQVVVTDLPRMEDRIMKAIEANKPRSPWPAVSALTAVLGVVLILAAAIYGQ